MIDLSRVANNAFVILIMFGFFYLIYSKFKGNQPETTEKIKNMFGGKQ